MNPDIEVLKARLDTYRTLLLDAARSLEQADEIIREEVEDADMDDGYTGLIASIRAALEAPDQAPVLDEKQKQILVRMLGMGDDISRDTRGYRNRYSVPEGTNVYRTLKALEGRGLVVEVGDHSTWPWFYATEAGMDAIGMTAEEKARAFDE